jgi:hypothetical protein
MAAFAGFLVLKRYHEPILDWGGDRAARRPAWPTILPVEAQRE